MTDTTNDFPAKLIYAPVVGFIQRIASKAPAPGGGSAAALSGAVGVSLLAMVIKLTVGKKGYEGVTEEFNNLSSKADDLRAGLTDAIDADTLAFERLVMAGKVPAATDEARKKKEAELAEANRNAIRVPQSTMHMCLEGLGLAPAIAERGNINTVSDAAAGAEMLLAGLEGAAGNVLINLPGVTSAEAEEFRKDVQTTREKGRSLLDQVRKIVDAKLSGCDKNTS